MIKNIFLALTSIPLLVLIFSIIVFYGDENEKSKRKRMKNIRRLKNRLVSRIDNPDAYEGEDLMERKETVSLRKKRQTEFSDNVGAQVF